MDLNKMSMFVCLFVYYPIIQHVPNAQNFDSFVSPLTFTVQFEGLR